ncbi:LysR substrate-binding domain-containing protein [Altererythrobacter sp. Root672]|uniref:LysR substrate-binding domain-containing protein n=1 Tax=Altererythrobacter sp. Root672 TaxID=1736584 RepID=UPI0009EACBF4|nr:LysR substrate-binding domain-containing protein [Altererythrobacter sp. Root672]
MNFQQLRYIRAAVQNDLNLTKVANELFTSQSGVSKQIKELEAELGIEIFVRRGKRLVGLTEAGHSAAQVIDRLLQESENLKRLSEQFVQADKGRLTIATTHNQANYVLPQVLVRFSREFPDVEVELRQGSPSLVVDMLLRGEADLGVATEAVDGEPGLQTFPCFTWEHVAIVPHEHPLARVKSPTLADLVRYPIVTYTPEFTGRSNIDAAFASAGLQPDFHLSAVDADVIKTYVKLGMGVGIVAQMAIENGPDDAFATVAGSNKFFKASSTKIAIPHGALLRNYTGRLIELLAPHLDARSLKDSRRLTTVHQPDILRSFVDRHDLRFGAGPRPILRSAISGANPA